MKLRGRALVSLSRGLGLIISTNYQGAGDKTGNPVRFFKSSQKRRWSVAGEKGSCEEIKSRLTLVQRVNEAENRRGTRTDSWGFGHEQACHEGVAYQPEKGPRMEKLYDNITYGSINIDL